MTPFEHILEKHRRVVMTGYPEVGKTTLAKTVTDRLVIHLDDVMEKYGFLETPREALKMLAGIEEWLVEGTQGFRLLRFALRNDLFTEPRKSLECIILVRSGVPAEDRHISFNKGCDTIWAQVVPMLNDIPVFDISGRLT